MIFLEKATFLQSEKAVFTEMLHFPVKIQKESRSCL